MSAPPLLPSRVNAAPARFEYLGFENVGEHREFRFRVCRPGEPVELRFRIALTAFGGDRLRMQDGPDICNQKLLKRVAAGEITGPDVISIDESDLAEYREAHTKVTKHRSSWTPSPAAKPAFEAPPPQRPRNSPAVSAPPVAKGVEPAFEEGQRVNHAIFGLGVTTSSTRSHTVICFDKDGSKTFVTSLVNVEVLSPPRTWETGPRGVNRPCRTP